VVRILLQSLHDVLGDGHEGLVHVGVHLGRGLVELDAVLLRQRAALLVCDFLYREA
jgi:hypothetical protein